MDAQVQPAPRPARRSPSSPGRPLGQTVLKALALAAGYLAGARLGLLLAIPPGYASAFWIPAGLAFMAILVGGPRLAPGILLGSLAHNVLISVAAGKSVATSLLIGGGIGVGACLQAVAGAYLVRRHVGYPTALTKVREILRFLLLAGPVACLVNATWSNGVLALAHFVTTDTLAFSWFNWWVGDSLGVVLCAPLWLVVAGRPRESWRGRLRTVALPMLGSIALALAAFVIVQRADSERIRVQFEAQAVAVAGRIQHELDADVALFESVRDYLRATRDIDAQSFSAFSGGAVAKRTGVRVVEWAPRVTSGERARFEREARTASGALLAITERAADSGLVPAGPRPQYFPVMFAEPLAGNEPALGFDLASEPRRRAAINASLRAGGTVVSEPVQLVQDARRTSSVIAFLPVYGSREDPATPRGFVVAPLEIAPLISRALAGKDASGLAFTLTDPSASKSLLYEYGPQQNGGPATSNAAPPDLVLSRRIDAPGRPWLVTFRPTAAFLASVRTPMPWIVQSTGLLCAGLLGLLFLALSGRNEEISREVQRQTQELADQGRRHEVFLRNAADGAHVLDATGRLVDASDSFCQMLGRPRDEVIGLSIPDWDPTVPRAELAARMANHFAGGFLRFATRHRRKDGSELEVEVQTDAFTYRGGRYLYCSARDMTELRALQRALIDASNRERQKLGYDLHDELGQVLTGISLLATALASGAAASRAAEPERLAELETLTRHAIGTCRAIAHGLSPLTYQRGDLIAALREMVNLQASACDATIRFSHVGDAPLTADLETKDHLYRIAQEALTNARRHARARHIDVLLEIEDEAIRLEVEDDGIGAVAATAEAPGMGLQIMRFRASMIRADLTVGRGSQGGTRIVVVCPQRAVHEGAAVRSAVL
ncbi:MAG: CHASE domain-containing protein [Proteobacteria bacterium]|nr:CHASE domain-containing protein [Pseudomonadota bacterium]